MRTLKDIESDMIFAAWNVVGCEQNHLSEGETNMCRAYLERFEKEHDAFVLFHIGG